MRYLGAFVVAGLLSVTSLHGQTVSSHSSLRIPTPAIDESEEMSASPSRSVSAVRSRSVPAREASLRQEAERFSSAGSDVMRPALVPLDDEAAVTMQDAGAARMVSATSALMPVSSAPVGTGVQYFGPSADASSALRPAASPAGYVTQANYGVSASPAATYSQPTVVPSAYPPALSTTTYSVPTSGVAPTSFSQPSYSVPTAVACCNGAPTSTVVSGMQPTFPTTSYSAAPYGASSYPTTTVLAPPIADAAAYPPTLNGSTIPGAGYPASAGASGTVVPYLVNPVAVNIPAVPVDESRLQPVVALRPTVPEESYAGRGILGQPELYVRGQHVRNILRYITLW